MNGIEDRLRDAYRGAAGTVQPDSLLPLAPPGQADTASRTARARQRKLVPLLAAAAVVLIAVTAVVIPHAWPGGTDSRSPAAVPQAFAGGRIPSAGRPRFIAEVRWTHSSITGRGNGTALTVVSATSGRVTGTLAPPRPGQYFQSVAALGGTKSFVAAAVDRHVCATYFYRFRLTRAGRPYGLVPLLRGAMPGQIKDVPDQLAGSGDGSTVAYSTIICDITRANLVRHLGDVGVIDVRTGSVRTWSYKNPASPYDLSLSADGRLLGLISNPSNGTRMGSESLNALWTLRTDSPPGQLARYYHQSVRRPAASASVDAGALSPTGHVAFAIVSRYNRKTWWRSVFGRYATRTGTPLGTVRVLSRQGVLTTPMTISADPSGRYVLWSEYNFVKEIDLATGRMTVLPGSPPELNGSAW